MREASRKENDMEWPFKTIKKNSSWPLQPLVIQFAAAILAAPADVRKAFAAKTIERCIRMGARLAVEFGVPAPLFMDIAKAQILREDPTAKGLLAEAFGEQVIKSLDGAESAVESVQAQVAEIFKGDTPPEA